MRGSPNLSDCLGEDSSSILEDREVRKFLSEERAARVIEYEKGGKVFEAREKIVGFYLICRGVVKEVSPWSPGEEVTLGLYKRGDLLFGDTFFLDRNYRETTAPTVTEVRVLMVEKEAFPELMGMAGRKLGRGIARNMRRLRRRLELGSCSVLENTAFWLIRLISDSPDSSFTISNKELSNIVGCSPVTISRKLGDLRRKGLVEKDGREVRIVDEEGLQAEINYTNVP